MTLLNYFPDWFFFSYLYCFYSLSSSGDAKAVSPCHFFKNKWGQALISATFLLPNRPSLWNTPSWGMCPAWKTDSISIWNKTSMQNLIWVWHLMTDLNLRLHPPAWLLLGSVWCAQGFRGQIYHIPLKALDFHRNSNVIPGNPCQLGYPETLQCSHSPWRLNTQFTPTKETSTLNTWAG